jgi:hypothetical protein
MSLFNLPTLKQRNVLRQDGLNTQLPIMSPVCANQHDIEDLALFSAPKRPFFGASRSL